MKVRGLRQRGVSMTKQTIVGSVDANASVIIAPEADLQNTGPSLTCMYLWSIDLGALLLLQEAKWTDWVATRVCFI